MLVYDHQCTAMATPLAAAKLRQSTQNPCRTLSIQLHSTQLLHILIIVTQDSSFFVPFFSIALYIAATQELHKLLFSLFSWANDYYSSRRKKEKTQTKGIIHTVVRRKLLEFPKRKKTNKQKNFGRYQWNDDEKDSRDYIIYIGQWAIRDGMAGYIRACKNVLNVWIYHGNKSSDESSLQN